MNVKRISLRLGHTRRVDVLQSVEGCSSVIDGCSCLTLGSGQDVLDTCEFQHALTRFTDDQTLALCSGHERDTGRSGTAVHLERNRVAWTGEDSHEPLPR